MESSTINSPSSSPSLSTLYSPTFLSAKGFSSPELKFPDIELTTLESESYTSLKDLLPDTPSTTATVSSPIQNSSWNEIPIKNPLVKQAALSYLQPMLTPPVAGENGFLRKLRKHGFGCLEWINDIVWSVIAEISAGGRRC